MRIESEHGICEYSFESDYVHIFNLAVLPEHREQGEARKLLNTAIKNIKSTGYHGEIQIVTSNEGLKAFYESLGLTVYKYYG